MQINSLKESLTRPKEILLKYRQLRRTALRDEAILGNIESKLDSLKLEKARQTNPWELISTPIILEKPFSPNKAKIISLTTLFGLISSSIFTLFISKISGVLYHKDQFYSLLPYEFIKTFPLKNKDNLTNNLRSFKKFMLSNSRINKKITFVKLGEIKYEIFDSFIYELKNEFDNNNLNILDNVFNAENENENDIILIAMPGKVTNQQIKLINEEISMQNLNVLGWIYLDPNLNI
tara:strand:- start:209 stop:913 length:705 start_codon:yes stop_codon:yes gene_type:complete